MYRGFKLEGNVELEEMVKDYEKRGQQEEAKKKKIIQDTLEEYVRGDGFIDCSRLQEAWFPEVKADIFLSHSHSDKKLVDGLVGWFKEKMGLEVFVDSNVWGYCNDLLRAIDEDYCLQDDDDTLFSYSKRNHSTAHVHMMLANSLNKMIDKCECVIFLETPNSLNVKDGIIKKETSSAWIYSEIMVTSMIRSTIPRRLLNKDIIEKKSYDILNETFKPIYTVDLNHLHEINKTTLQTMLNSTVGYKKTDYLDTLYKITNKGRVEVLNG